MQKDYKEERDRERFIEELVEETVKDFEERREKRLSIERQWELNMNFLNGNQYVGINSKGELYEKDLGAYYWQQRGVFNHIAPIMETRISRLLKVKPKVSVRPKTDDDSDVSGALIAEKAIEGLFDNVNFKDIVRKVTLWSESCGTGFYKIVWDNDGGKELGVLDGKKVKEGDVKITVVSPFEIFPDSLSREEIEECVSIIHARALPVSKIKEMYGVEVDGEDVDLSTLTVDNKTANYNENKNLLKDARVVIEKYEKPTERFPLGRLITVAGDKLLYYGDLPYINGKDKSRTFPFVKQESIDESGRFFGRSVIERLIPVQRAYNAVKNRKHEFINRLSTGIMMVEDGSVDVDDLEQEGLPPGKILVYRQGSKEPRIMDGFEIPTEFNDEEARLISEFDVISGVSDVSSSARSSLTHSGNALEILVEQDNERIVPSAERIRDAYLQVARHVIRLYSQFLAGVKMVKFKDDSDKTHVYYLDAKAVNSDETFLRGENELTENLYKKRDTVLKLYEQGLLSDDDGNIRPSVKENVLSILGFSELVSNKGLSRLQMDRASKENEIIKKEQKEIEEIDNDVIHIEEHTRFALSEYDQLSAEEKQRIFKHIKMHKERINKEKEN